MTFSLLASKILRVPVLIAVIWGNMPESYAFAKNICAEQSARSTFYGRGDKLRCGERTKSKAWLFIGKKLQQKCRFDQKGTIRKRSSVKFKKIGKARFDKTGSIKDKCYFKWRVCMTNCK